MSKVYPINTANYKIHIVFTLGNLVYVRITSKIIVETIRKLANITVGEVLVVIYDIIVCLHSYLRRAPKVYPTNTANYKIHIVFT